MGLIHWWPLNGDIKDYGLNPADITANSPTYANNGKIGKAIYFNGSTYYNTVKDYYKENIENHSFSFGGWYKHDTSTSKSNSTEGLISLNYGWTIFTTASNIQMRYELESSIPTVGYSCSPQDGKWHHIFATFKFLQGNSVISLYYDGTCVKTQTITATIVWNRWYFNRYVIGTETNNSSVCACLGWLNDLRIYDHALSVKEVKELSKALVLHYDFEDEEIEGTVNLGNTSASYSDKTNGSTENCSAWGGDAGTCTWYHYGGYNNYPYKVYHKTATGTGGIYRNTTEDIVIEAGKTYTMSVYIKASRNINSASAYTFNINRNSGNRYITYNQSFNITTEWKRLVRTFTASDADAGTYKEMSIVYDDTETDYYVYYSGFQIEEKDHVTPYVNGTRTGVVYDSSGYNYNGASGSDISISSSSIVGTKSLQLSGGTKGNPNSSYIEIPNSPDLNIWTVNIWCNLTAWSKNGTQQCLISGKTYNGNYDGYMKIDLIGQKLGVRATSQGSGYNDYVVCNTAVQLNTPCMLTIVSDGTTLKGYFNGVYEKTVTPDAKYGNKYSPGSIGRAWSDGYWNPDGLIYDFKVYATSLSAADVLAEYNRKAAIDRNGNLFTGSIVEYESTNNMLELAAFKVETQAGFDGHLGSIKKTSYDASYPNANSAGIGKYEQANLKVTMTDDGVRIYSAPNLTTSANGSTMWGGLCLSPMKHANCLVKGHRYRLSFHVSGQSSRDMSDIYFSSQVGWGNVCAPSPSNTKIIRHGSNFQGEKDCYFEFTINDDIWKVCPSTNVSGASGYNSAFTAGETYLSYAAIKLGYNYASTGELGTDIYVSNIKLHDITDNKVYKINKNNTINTTEIITGRRNSARINSDGVISVNNIIEL